MQIISQIQPLAKPMPKRNKVNSILINFDFKDESSASEDSDDHVEMLRKRMIQEKKEEILKIKKDNVTYAE